MAGASSLNPNLAKKIINKPQYLRLVDLVNFTFVSHIFIRFIDELDPSLENGKADTGQNNGYLI